LGPASAAPPRATRGALGLVDVRLAARLPTSSSATVLSAGQWRGCGAPYEPDPGRGLELDWIDKYGAGSEPYRMTVDRNAERGDGRRSYRATASFSPSTESIPNRRALESTVNLRVGTATACSHAGPFSRAVLSTSARNQTNSTRHQRGWFTTSVRS
jgi:hypothetical protein